MVITIIIIPLGQDHGSRDLRLPSEKVVSKEESAARCSNSCWRSSRGGPTFAVATRACLQHVMSVANGPMIFRDEQAGSAEIRRFVPCGPRPTDKRPNQDAAPQILLKDSVAVGEDPSGPLEFPRAAEPNEPRLIEHVGMELFVFVGPRGKTHPCTVLFQTPIVQRHDTSHPHPDWSEKGNGEAQNGPRRIYQTLPSTKAPLKRASNVRTRRLGFGNAIANVDMTA